MIGEEKVAHLKQNTDHWMVQARIAAYITQFMPT